MDETLHQILVKTRELSFKHRIRGLTIEKIADLLGVEKQVLQKYVKNKGDLIVQALEFERNSFKTIFDKNDFEGVNAIDILFTVSKELSIRFKDINPSLTAELRRYYPAVYKKHITDKYNFIFNKISINIEKGTQQKMYRSDLSVELIARLYIARLMDIHDPQLFPTEKFSFDLLFHYTIENFVRNIATEDGWAYYEIKKKSFNKGE